MSTTSPARSGVPSRDIVSASHRAANSGLPRHAAPEPVERTSPLSDNVIVAVARSRARLTGTVPSTKREPLALSATVSAKEMSHPATRLSTISSTARA